MKLLVPSAQVGSSTLAALSTLTLPEMPACPQRKLGEHDPMACSVALSQVISKALCFTDSL